MNDGTIAAVISGVCAVVCAFAAVVAVRRSNKANGIAEEANVIATKAASDMAEMAATQLARQTRHDVPSISFHVECIEAFAPTSSKEVKVKVTNNGMMRTTIRTVKVEFIPFGTPPDVWVDTPDLEVGGGATRDLGTFNAKSHLIQPSNGQTATVRCEAWFTRDQEPDGHRLENWKANDQRVFLLQ